MQKSLFLCAVTLLAVVLAQEAVDEKDVVVLTPENFDEVISSNDNVLVEFYAPWCGHCKKLVPEYAAAATSLKTKNVNAVLAKVDADAHKDLGNRYQIQGFPTLKWFVKGTPVEYKGGRTGNDIANWVTKRVSDPVVKLADAAALDKFLAENEFAVVAFLDDSNADVIENFKRVAAGEDELNLALVSDASLASAHGQTIPSIVAFRPEIAPHQSRTVKYEGDLSSSEAIAKFVSGSSLGLVTEFSQQTASKIFGNAIKTQVLLFTDSKADDTTTVKDGFLAAAAQSLGKAVFVTVDGSNTQVLDYFGVKQENLPCVFLVHAAEGAGLKKYSLATKPTTDGVVAFLGDYLAGNLKPHIKSEPVPLDNSAPVKVLVGTTFDEIVLDTTKDVFVEFYAPWCGHCQSLAPIYDKFAKELQPVESIVIAKMDATANDPPENVNIRGFPTLMLFKANDKSNPVSFDGERTAKGMKQFLSTHASIPFTMPKKAKKNKTA